MKSKSKIISGIVIVIVIVIVFLAGSWAWLSTGELTAAKENIYSVLPFPAALINGQPVSLQSFIARYKLAQKSIPQTEALSPREIKSKVFTRLLQEKMVDKLAADKKVSATKQQIEDEYNRQAGQISGFENTITGNGIDLKTYKNDIVKSQVTAANLTIWFFTQRDLNAQSYAAADSILQKIRAGQNFGDLAAVYSQDTQSKNMDGDVGFADADKILPEMLSAAQNMQIGQTKIVPTRYGLEVSVLESKDNNGQSGRARYHLKQIFINGSDFYSWYREQAKKIKVIQIIKF